MAHVWAFAGISSLITSSVLTLNNQNTIAKFVWKQIPSDAEPYPKLKLALASGPPQASNHTVPGTVVFPFVLLGTFIPLRVIPGTILVRLLNRRYNIKKTTKQYQSISSSLYGSCPKIFVNTFFSSFAFPVAVFSKIYRDGPGVFDPDYYGKPSVPMVYDRPTPTGDMQLMSSPLSILQITSNAPERYKGT